MLAFMSKFQPDDIVNVLLAVRDGDPVSVYKIRIAKMRETTFDVLLAKGSLHVVKFADIHQRFKFPLKPKARRE